MKKVDKQIEEIIQRCEQELDFLDDETPSYGRMTTRMLVEILKELRHQRFTAEAAERKRIREAKKALTK